jgi:glycosyltransferase involved in cell wall biosynthesis
LLDAFGARCPDLLGKRFLLFLGRLHPKKGCDLLIKAFAQIGTGHPDLHLVMAGPDPANWREELSTELPAGELSERVHWPGMLQGEAKWGAFAASEVFVLPSHQENFGIAAVEALASAKPILLAHPVNIAPDIERAGCGLVEDDTLEGTKRLLMRWLALSDVERQAMSDRAIAMFQDCYDMRRNTEAILRIFESARASKTIEQHQERTEAQS